MTYNNLLAPGRISELELRNRIIMTPMGTNLAQADGHCGERLQAYYEARARGGVGMVIVGPLIPTSADRKQVQSRSVLSFEHDDAIHDGHHDSGVPDLFGAYGREVAVDDRDVDLTSTEFDFLSRLAASPGQVVSITDLLKSVWGVDDTSGGTQLVRSMVRNTRAKIGDDPLRPRFIATKRGVGYLLLL